MRTGNGDLRGEQVTWNGDLRGEQGKTGVNRGDMRGT